MCSVAAVPQRSEVIILVSDVFGISQDAYLFYFHLRYFWVFYLGLFSTPATEGGPITRPFLFGPMNLGFQK